MQFDARTARADELANVRASIVLQAFDPRIEGLRISGICSISCCAALSMLSACATSRVTDLPQPKSSPPVRSSPRSKALKRKTRDVIGRAQLNDSAIYHLLPVIGERTAPGLGSPVNAGLLPSMCAADVVIATPSARSSAVHLTMRLRNANMLVRRPSSAICIQVRGCP